MLSDDEDCVTWDFNSPMNRARNRNRQRLAGERFSIGSQSPMRPAGRSVRQSNMFGLGGGGGGGDNQVQPQPQPQQETATNSLNPERLKQFSRGLQQFTSLCATNNGDLAVEMDGETDDFACDFKSPLPPLSPLPSFDFEDELSSSLLEDAIAAEEEATAATTKTTNDNIDAIFGPEDNDIEQQLNEIDEQLLIRTTAAPVTIRSVPPPSATTTKKCTPEEIARKRDEACARLMAKKWEMQRTKEDLRSKKTAAVGTVANVSNNNHQYQKHDNSKNSSQSSSSSDEIHVGYPPASRRGIPNNKLLNNLRAFPRR